MAAIGTWTLGRFRDHAKARLKQYTTKFVTNTDWRDIINLCTDEAHELIGLKNAPEYRSNVSIAAYGTGVNAQVDSYDLTSLTGYKLIDKITTCYDSTYGIFTEIDTEAEFWAIVGGEISGSTKYNHGYREEVIWCHAGERVLLGKGLPGITVGTVKIGYQRLPAHVTAVTDLIDMKDSNAKQLMDMCLLAALHTLREPIPSDLKTSENKLVALREQTMKERETLNKNLQGA